MRNKLDVLCPQPRLPRRSVSPIAISRCCSDKFVLEKTAPTTKAEMSMVELTSVDVDTAVVVERIGGDVESLVKEGGE